MNEGLMAFLAGLIACYIGGIPFGMINLTVTDLSLRKGIPSALGAATGAAFVEIFQAWIALLFGAYVSEFLAQNTYVNLVFAAILVILGIVFWLRKEKPTMEPVRKRKLRGGSFFKGMAAAVLNPQAVPFWLFVLAWFSTSLDYSPASAQEPYRFLAGVFAGKFLILSTFALGARMIRQKFNFACNCADKVLGSVFIILAIVQFAKYI